jgi:hypothetical protein
MLTPTATALQRFQQHVVSQSKRNLTTKNKNVSKGLYNSIKGDVKQSANSIQILFTMLDYGFYQDRGVKGVKSGRSLSGFKFGTKTGEKGGLTEGIYKWVKARNIQFRERRPDGTSTGKFLSSRQTANLITRSIWNKGIKPTEFFSKPFEAAYKNLPSELVETYGLEAEALFDQILTQNFKKK